MGSYLEGSLQAAAVAVPWLCLQCTTCCCLYGCEQAQTLVRELLTAGLELMGVGGSSRLRMPLPES